MTLGCDGTIGDAGQMRELKLGESHNRGVKLRIRDGG